MILFFLVSIVTIVLSLLIFRNLLNPIAIHALSFCAQAVLYCIAVSIDERFDLHFEVLINENEVFNLYIIAIVGHALGWISLNRKKAFLANFESFESFRIQRYFKSIIIIELGVLLSIIIVFIVVIGFPLGAMLNGSYDIQQTNENIKNLPFGMLGLMLWVSIVLSLHWILSFELRKAKIIYSYKYWLIFIFFLLVFSSVFYGKRQLLMIMLFFFSLAYMLRIRNYFDAIKGFSVLVFYFFLFFSLYVILQYVRTGGSGDGKGDVFFFELTLSALWPIMNLGVVVHHELVSYEFSGIISQIIPNRLFGHGTDHITPFLFEPTASTNYVQYAYMDFGIYGVFFFSMFFAWISRFFCALKVGFVTKYSIRFLVIWCCATASVYSHGFSNNYFLFPIFILLLQDKILGWKLVPLAVLRTKYER